ncbi:MAG TPA: VWA domain-containing protein [Pyrinomonadaceae bacterium]|nr:VWA domain-containing protein [Pyrinomonadaceae bacterium]
MRKCHTRPLSALLLTSLLLTSMATARQNPAPQTAPTQTATPAPQPTPTPPGEAAEPEDEVVRITSNLVQLDAVVTDDEGRRVSNLAPEDFEVIVDGRQQQVTHLSYISEESNVSAAPPPKKSAGKDAAPHRTVRLRPGQVRRTIALVVDTLCSSFENAHFARRALEKFVNEQMQENDLVAVIQTKGGTGMLQQFTSDRRLLLAAIKGVRWNASSSRMRLCARDDSDPFEGTPITRLGEALQGGRKEHPAGTAAAEARHSDDAVRLPGTLSALGYIVKGMRELPGRKSVVVLSDGFPYVSVEEGGEQAKVDLRAADAYRRLIDLANRSSVVVYTMDLSGLPTLGLSAADRPVGFTAAEVAKNNENLLRSRRLSHFHSTTGMRKLAEETGGFFVGGTNDIAKGIRRASDDQNGYYLIGFRPDEKSFSLTDARPRFNRFKLKVKRPGLKVRTRTGFYGFDEKDAAPPPRTRDNQLMAALTSPFAAADVGVRLTSVYGGEADRTPFVSSLLHVDLGNLKFTEEADGWRQAVFDIMAATFNADGSIVDQVNRTETFRARGETLDFFLRNGTIYMMQLPVRNPGIYQVRVAVRDAVTEKAGSATQFVEVPDLKKRRLTLTGIIMQEKATAAPPGPSPSPSPTTGAQSPVGSAVAGGPAVRRFRKGSEIAYTFHVYNAKVERETGRPRLQVQVGLFRDGKPVFTSPPQPLDPGQQADMKRLVVAYGMRLGADLGPGEYDLQVVITDTLADEKGRVATQWVDFEVIG